MWLWHRILSSTSAGIGLGIRAGLFNSPSNPLSPKNLPYFAPGCLREYIVCSLLEYFLPYAGSAVQRMTSLWHVRGLVIAALLLVLFVWLFSRDEEIKIPERRKHAQRDHRPRDRGVTPATSREPVLESQVESTAALPTTRASLAPSNAAPIRVAWLNRKMNLFYRADPILDILENVSGLRATLIAPGGGAFAHDAVDVFLIQANYLTDVKKVRLAHSNHSLFLFVATEPLFDGNNFLAVSDVSFGQAPLAPNGIAACTSASAAHHFLRTPLWVFGVVNCSALPVAPCGVSEELRAASQIDPASWAARPNFALHVARHGGFPRELLLSAFRKTATRLSAAQAGAAGSAGGSAAGSMLQSLARRKRRVDCPGPGGDGREFQNMRWPKHVPGAWPSRWCAGVAFPCYVAGGLRSACNRPRSFRLGRQIQR